MKSTPLPALSSSSINRTLCSYGTFVSAVPPSSEQRPDDAIHAADGRGLVILAGLSSRVPMRAVSHGCPGSLR